MKTTIVKLIGLTLIIAAMMMFLNRPSVFASTDCTFTINGNTMVLNGDCITDESILVSDGFTLDGNGYTITAVDPPAGHFTGAVITNVGTTASIKNVTVTTSGLSNVCDAGNNRLRGIMLEGASGTISHNTVIGINQGASGCQEGNAIEVRNAPFDGTHPNTMVVDVTHNNVVAYQKTGIVANGDVAVTIEHNAISASATQENLAANSVQLGYGALGSVTHNNIEGNQWMGTSDWAATAVLVYAAGEVEVSNNNIRGNSDIGLYIYADNGIYNNNRIFDEGADHPNSSYDYGLGNWGTNNIVTNNKVRGFDVPYDGDVDGNNKAIPGGPID